MLYKDLKRGLLGFRKDELREAIRREFITEFKKYFDYVDLRMGENNIVVLGNGKYPLEYLKIAVHETYEKVKRNTLPIVESEIAGVTTKIRSKPVSRILGPEGIKGLALFNLGLFGSWLGFYEQAYYFTPIISGLMISSGILLVLEEMGLWPILSPKEFEYYERELWDFFKFVQKLRKEHAYLEGAQLLGEYEKIEIKFKGSKNR